MRAGVSTRVSSRSAHGTGLHQHVSHARLHDVQHVAVRGGVRRRGRRLPAVRALPSQLNR